MSSKSETMKCPKCGKPIKPGQKFCGYCGTSLIVTETPHVTPDRNNKINAHVEQKHRNEEKQEKKEQSSHPQSSEKKPQTGQIEKAPSKNKHGCIWLLIVAAILALVIFKPWIPKGESDPDTVMTWSYKHDNKIFEEFEENNMNASYTHRQAVQIMENDKRHTFVFKYNGHYVYLVRLIDTYADMYTEQVVGISKDKDGNVYHHGLTRKDMDSIDANASVGNGWTAIQFERMFE